MSNICNSKEDCWKIEKNRDMPNMKNNKNKDRLI